MLFTSYSNKYRIDYGYEDAVEITLDTRDSQFMCLTQEDLEQMLEELKEAKESMQ